jgi:hypothetical protein
MSPEEKTMTRREFLKNAALVGAGVAGTTLLGGTIYKLGEWYERWLREPGEIPPPSPIVPTARAVETPSNAAEAATPTATPEIRSQQDFLQVWSQEIQRAQETGQPAEIQLPEGEIVFDSRSRLEVPAGVGVRVCGHPNGSRLRLTEAISRLPDPSLEPDRSWQGHEFNLMEIVLGQKASLTVEDIEFDGGSARAGVGDYQAPLGPWNAILGIYGEGKGAGNLPAGERTGTCQVNNCRFSRSEAPGLVVQNLGRVTVDGCRGDFLDTLVTVNWCGRAEINNCQAHNCLSDAFYIVVSKNVTIEKCLADVARQGFDIHGSTDVRLANCSGRQCAEFITLSRAEANGTGCEDVVIDSCPSVDCNLAYSIQFAKNVTITGGRHEGAGNWWAESDFLHTGIARREELPPISVWINWGTVEGLTFSDVRISKGDKAPADYQIGKTAEGINFVGFNQP